MSTQKQRIGIKSDKRLSGLVARLWGTITQMDREHKSPPEDQTGARLTNRIQYFNWITVHLMFYQKADTSRPVHDTMPTVAIVGIIIQNEGRNRGASLCNDQVSTDSVNHPCNEFMINENGKRYHVTVGVEWMNEKGVGGCWLEMQIEKTLLNLTQTI
ncbi:hypothetical protein T4D_16386 [Trichinella pseudospiralis]|uniref:Uncharacterized protein n=1 Tax=Trichinella pseudospiralis TaxID=6337 RepID=A0A0V1FUM7_TRIPS|nr:hypothetical protein T4D_16386 [Trichinella pseudospiralis]